MEIDELEQTLMALYRKGLVSIEYTPNLEATFAITPLGEKVLSSGMDNNG
jgi:DNA-binding PadR family transcriptional regulator